ncbi:DNA-binding PadR family transcriptional regulator [Microbacterium resistens]|uniref:DNA-binding PadR family transcriptional regulator n=1 Tax=Microbacterium resistens TaxID=156977 RepID=A0ABU1S9S7_9MICO|nr:helix-turn-helix transcriptional regulator [Microbacterium resistens]MDR6866364.1 DNA-binding PadR family transcriptional regulator [Microbacterium resistens]
MSVRQSLLALLAQGPCYGYQLRAEFARRTGSAWPLNVGQIYNTLERLERDGLVERGAADDRGHVYWTITPAGSADASSWLATPVERDRSARDEVAIKVALAATLPGADAAAVIRDQRDEVLRRLEDLGVDDDPRDAAGLAAAIVASARRAAVEAELRWLDDADRLLSAHRHDALPLAADLPRRGRPSVLGRVEAPAGTPL